MYSGSNFYSDFTSRIGKFSKFVDKFKLKRICDRALNTVIQREWASLTNQKVSDDLRYMVSTENVFKISNGSVSTSPLFIETIVASGNVITITAAGVHNLAPLDVITISDAQGIITTPNMNGDHTVTGVPNKNKIEFIVTTPLGAHIPNTGKITHSKLISNYIHLFALKAQFQEELPIKIVKSVNNVPSWIEFNKRTNLRNGDKIIISNFSDQAVNGVRYVQHLTDFRVRLFTDKDLKSPLINIAGSNIEGGKIKKETYNYASNWASDDKISSFKQGTIDSPVFETSDNSIKITPSHCLEVTVDYLATPKIDLDLNDNTVDLLLIFPFSFIDKWLNESVAIYSNPARDPLLEQMTARTEARNA